MKGKHYTFFIASSASGSMRRHARPALSIARTSGLALVGSITVAAAMGSYSRMLWKAASYNSLRRDQDALKQQYKALQTEVKDTNQRLDSLQSLASEVAMAYGIARFRQTPFAFSDDEKSTPTFKNRWTSLLTFNGMRVRWRCRTAVCACCRRLS